MFFPFCLLLRQNKKSPRFSYYIHATKPTKFQIFTINGDENENENEDEREKNQPNDKNLAYNDDYFNNH